MVLMCRGCHDAISLAKINHEDHLLQYKLSVVWKQRQNDEQARQSNDYKKHNCVPPARGVRKCHS